VKSKLEIKFGIKFGKFGARGAREEVEVSLNRGELKLS
jgi:hypothetical protein